MIIEITVSINGVELKGDLLQIIDILHIVYKVPSPVIYQLMGEVGVFVINKESLSFTRPYGGEGKVWFHASVKKL
jgi:hypothetical protein